MAKQRKQTARSKKPPTAPTIQDLGDVLAALPTDDIAKILAKLNANDLAEIVRKLPAASIDDVLRGHPQRFLYDEVDVFIRDWLQGGDGCLQDMIDSWMQDLPSRDDIERAFRDAGSCLRVRIGFDANGNEVWRLDERHG